MAHDRIVTDYLRKLSPNIHSALIRRVAAS